MVVNQTIYHPDMPSTVVFHKGDTLEVKDDGTLVYLNNDPFTRFPKPATPMSKQAYDQFVKPYLDKFPSPAPKPVRPSLKEQWAAVGIDLDKWDPTTRPEYDGPSPQLSYTREALRALADKKVIDMYGIVKGAKQQALMTQLIQSTVVDTVKVIDKHLVIQDDYHEDVWGITEQLFNDISN
ncbi:hypothetical protein AVT69_gp306 [Pseudomonas phage PhiPA3]|uniref:Uncharacterized protein 308 n=1 Tax=Pseudomonas phage PhiPA3 TaxID=998086 RepID=F8SJE4_BPPA3|nr:hypothetical protein AVT69_gp306 [Pseudomonas phage PhiPA3]AEH03731.1 hypothetical protein [Pseudomonas phage PhiPA3]